MSAEFIKCLEEVEKQYKNFVRDHIYRLPISPGKATLERLSQTNKLYAKCENFKRELEFTQKNPKSPKSRSWDELKEDYLVIKQAVNKCGRYVTYRKLRESFIALKAFNMLDDQKQIYKVKPSKIEKTKARERDVQAYDLHAASSKPFSEGVYRRSQKQHDFHGQGLNAFGERTKTYFDQVYAYNIGANASDMDNVFRYHTAQQKRRKKRADNSSIRAVIDRILTHKLATLKKIVDGFQPKNADSRFFKIDSQQLAANYPCLIIIFDKIPGSNEGIPEGYPEFATHWLLAHINLRLQAEDAWPIVTRRQSFGFLTPTITDVHSGVRLSLGITPNQKFIDCVIQGIVDADNALGSLTFNDDNPACPHQARFLDLSDEDIEKHPGLHKHVVLDKFRGGLACACAHKILRAKIEEKDTSKGQMLSVEDINSSFGTKANKEEFMLAYNTYATGDLAQDEAVHDNPLNSDFTQLEVDNEAKELFELLINIFTTALHKYAPEKKRSYPDYQNLSQALNRMSDDMVVQTVQENPFFDVEDTSDDESGQNNFYSPSGMSSLFGPMVALKEAMDSLDLNEEQLPIPYSCLKYSYFEASMSWNRTLHNEFFTRADLLFDHLENMMYKASLEREHGRDDTYEYVNQHYRATITGLIEELKNTNTLVPAGDDEEDKAFLISALPNELETFVEGCRKPYILHIDNNPCVNTTEAPVMVKASQLLDVKYSALKMIILDITSSTSEQVKAFIDDFHQQETIPLLVTAASSVKHGELGLDGWQLGENKVYLCKALKQEQEHQTLYAKVKSKLKRITRSTESGYSRLNRRLLREAVNETLLSQ
ncbi:hypothetical protein [Thalassomonas haliotis]|uniref:Uncharacterized protein n=1 Tax=Thalassomonas haliotis TaxID=485448 RepID=A0ABY7V931_9GAMM|nr:hypothetical protein [Thalassomonas haliotis]WDE09730.1 hypothetical protein H3N35_15530 [Thalassomonas haliotis]